MTKKILVVGNWKMNQSLKEIEAFFSEFLNTEIKNLKNTTIGFAPQFLHLPLLLQKLTLQIKLSKQIVSTKALT